MHRQRQYQQHQDHRQSLRKASFNISKDCYLYTLFIICDTCSICGARPTPIAECYYDRRVNSLTNPDHLQTRGSGLPTGHHPLMALAPCTYNPPNARKNIWKSTAVIFFLQTLLVRRGTRHSGAHIPTPSRSPDVLPLLGHILL